jgi:hypothetical protein
VVGGGKAPKNEMLDTMLGLLGRLGVSEIPIGLPPWNNSTLRKSMELLGDALILPSIPVTEELLTLKVKS